MSRRHAAIKRVISPDTKYNSVLVSKFINHLMRDGKKSLAEKLFTMLSEGLKKSMALKLLRLLLKL
jgi:small subunit ribosomal protein S7